MTGWGTLSGMGKVRLQAHLTADEKRVIDELCDRFGLSQGELIMRALMPYYEAFNPGFLRHPRGRIVRRRRRREG